MMKKFVYLIIIFCTLLFTLTNCNKKNIIYENTDYGFTVTLPNNWQGYTVFEKTWAYRTQVDMQNGIYNEDNLVYVPEILIRHPLWTDEKPLFDIEIIINPTDVWEQVENELLLSGTPVPPSECARNSAYVFAMPPRYNFYESYEDVRDFIADAINAIET